MLPFAAFASSGFLVGLMVAFSADQLSRVVIPLLFAAFGGSIAAFSHKLSPQSRKDAYIGLLALSVACTAGLVLGVLAVQYRWLSPAVAHAVDERAAAAALDHYTRKFDVSSVKAIENEVAQGQLTPAQGYDHLLEALSKDTGK